jgi:hypothetical protein
MKAIFIAPYLLARRPPRGAKRIIGTAKRVRLSPMNHWLAPRSERKIAQIDSYNPNEP